MRILVFCPNWVGDVIFTTPVYPALKKAYPESYVSCIVPQRCRDILRFNPYVDEVITFDERSYHRSVREKLRFVSSLRKAGYDTVFLLHRSFTRTLICYLAGIKQRVGYAYRKRVFLLTHRVPVVDKDSLHKQDYYLMVVEDYGVSIRDKNCRVYIPEEARMQADALISHYEMAGSFLIALSPVTNWPPKDWPLDYFERLINLMRGRFGKVKFFITGSSCHDFFPSFKDTDFVINLSGKTTLLELAALYKRMDLVIAGDSGPLHLAASVGAPYIGIYGPTDPRLTSPRASVRGKVIFHNDTCTVPCYVKECDKGFICMRSVTPEEVADEASELLQKQG